MWDSEKQANEHGVVLVIALLVTAIIFVMAFALAYNISSYIKITSAAKQKTQTYYATVAGVEQMREHFRSNNCVPPTWCGRLGLATDPTASFYQDITAALTGAADSAPFFGTGSTYNTYLKDNEDGDSTFTSDNDQIVLASVKSDNPSMGAVTTVEAMLIFNADEVSNYMQQGKSASKRSTVRGSGPGTTNQRQTITR